MINNLIGKKYRYEIILKSKDDDVDGMLKESWEAKDERITVKSVVTLQLYNFLIARVPSARKFSRRN